MSEEESSRCHCCGQKRPFPTKAGLWEYMECPLFDPDGNVMECYGKRWVRASVVDVGQFDLDESGKPREISLRLVVSGMKRAWEWPKSAAWRKVGDVPEVDAGEVIDEGYRARDGQWMGKWDDEHEAVKRRVFIDGR